jgi:hypothetical protein
MSQQPMTEEQIEQEVERRIDAIDVRFMNGGLSQYDYDQQIAEVDAWAQGQYNRLVRS